MIWSKFPVIVGVSPPLYNTDELVSLEKAETDTHEWSGKLYTLYELMQKRNELKRAATKKQREIAGFDELDELDIDKAEEKRGVLDVLENKLIRTIYAIEANL